MSFPALSRRICLAAALALVVASCSKTEPAPPEAAAPATAPALTQVRISINDPLLPTLANSLGYFKREGVELVVVDVGDISEHDYLMQKPLVEGKLDASYHWFQHVVFGARHNLPLQAVIMINDAPGMKVLVANRVKDKVRSAADFKGLNIAEGAGYATKSVLVNYLAHSAGLPHGSYKPVLKEVEGRQQAVLAGLQEGRVDVMAFMEPMTSAIEATGLTSTLYDLTNRAGTTQALGQPWLAHTLFLSKDFIAKNPQTVQKLVNALVSAMRYVNSHDPQQIIDALPAEYFTERDRAAELTRVTKLLPMYARDNYALTTPAVQLVVDVVKSSKFDESEEGQFRATGENTTFKAEDLYDNRFVEQAMKDFP